MRQIYAPDAVLTFSIATDSIAFPQRVVGIDQITETLIVDFAAKYSRCKTFYVCESQPGEAEKTAILPWLVLMRESALARLRIGKGYYKWTFEPRSDGGLQVVAMHIYIAAMDAVDDADGHLLSAAQSALTYPWLRPTVMRSKLGGLAETDPTFAFLSAFTVPLGPAMCGQPLPPPARR